MCSGYALSFLSNVREVSPHTPHVRSISDTAAVAHHMHHCVLCTTSFARQCFSTSLTLIGCMHHVTAKGSCIHNIQLEKDYGYVLIFAGIPLPG